MWLFTTNAKHLTNTEEAQKETSLSGKKIENKKDKEMFPYKDTLIGIEGVACNHVGADGVVIFVALTDDSMFTVKTFLKRQKHKMKDEETKEASNIKMKKVLSTLLLYSRIYACDYFQNVFGSKSERQDFTE